MLPDEGPEARRAERRAYGWLLAAMGAYFAALMVYAQTRAYTGDEGFHFLADQLIREGMQPYLDFCYPQASLNNYWNVMWMGLFGESWRAVHAISTVLTALAIFLIADFVFWRFPAGGAEGRQADFARWRLAAALVVLLLGGVDQLVVEYGPLGQAYGMCLLASAAAFRCALRAIDRKRAWIALGAGFFAGVAPASSLLTAAIPPVVVVWILLHSRAGNRWWKAAAAAVGAAVPFAPTIWLLVQGPFQVWFNVVRYHTQYRRLYWSETTQHDLEVMTSWIDSGQALLLGLLALAGLLYIARRSSWSLARRAEFYLCGWLSLGVMGEVAVAHPTFPRYFLLAVPFLAALAAAGVYFLSTRLLQSQQARWPVLLLAFLSLLNCGKSLYERRDMFTWGEYEEIAKKIREVTPAGGQLYADEQTYFLTHIKPIPGLEFGYSHKVPLPPKQLARLHIITQKELNQKIKSGFFATAFTCDSDEISNLGMDSLYSHKKDMYDCTVFWGPQPQEGSSATEEKNTSSRKP